MRPAILELIEIAGLIIYKYIHKQFYVEGASLLDYSRYIDPEDWEMTMMIPMTEFDGNESLNIATDQNP